MPATSEPPASGVRHRGPPPTGPATDAADCRPVVFLLGWTGCQPRHLTKYADLYAGLGCRPICFTEHCAFSVLWRPGVLSTLAEQLLARAGEERPVAVHVFSNGGSFLWARALALAYTEQQLMEQLLEHGECEEEGELGSIRGQILDSTPGRLADVKGGYHFLSEMAGSNRLAQAALLLLFPLAVLLLVPIWLLTAQCLSHCSAERAWKAGWAQRAPSLGISNTLLLHSTRGDKLIDASSVKQFAAEVEAAAMDHEGRQAVLAIRQQRKIPREAIPARVVVKEWADTAHVAHYRAEPEAYREAVRSFLQGLRAEGSE